jgi:enoyl-CoA hydratase
MSWESFDLQVTDRVAHLVLNRPEKRNALSLAFWRELPRAVRELDEAAQARVLVISSTGSYFSSGIDTSMFGSFRASAEGPDGERRARLTSPMARYEGILAFQRCFTALEQCRMPVIAAVQGGCIGGALDLASACCMRYASADAFFSIHEINVGMPADMGTFPRLARFVPEGMVRELAYTGRRMPAAEARERGLVNHVFATQQDMVEGVLGVARDIAAKAPLAVSGSKRLITYGRDHGTADTLEHVALWIAGLVPSEQIMEAARANAGRRTADFVDLPPLPQHRGMD